MNVNTGEIIAMLSLPDFDPNLNMQPDERAQFNFPTKGLCEPGSVFKILTPRWDWKAEKSNSPTVLTPPSRSSSNTNIIKDYRGENRWLDLQEILIYSSNIGSAQIALKVGKQEQKASCATWDCLTRSVLSK